MLRLYGFMLVLLAGSSQSRVAQAEAQFPSETVRGLQAVLRDYAAFVDQVGVSLFVTDGTHSFAGVSGLANRQDKIEMPVDAQFRVGSHTKTVVAILALQLIDRGQLSLDDQFGQYFPEYSQFSKIRLRELLGMRSGIAEYLNSPWGLWTLATTPKQPRQIADLLQLVKAEPLEFEPGTACKYSNSNYLAVGMILEKITGKTVAQLIDERIVTPLGLQSTFLAEDNQIIPRLVHGYLDVTVGAAIWDISPIFYYAFDPSEQLGDGLVDATYHLHPTLAGPTGALVSTPEDMAKILRALFKGELVSSSALAAMMSARDCVLADQTVEYGMGLFRWDSPHGRMYGHGGINFGFRTGTFHHSDRGITFSLMSNYYPDQLEPFISEMLSILAGQGGPPSEVCETKKDFFDFRRDDVLNLSFRGAITEVGAKPASSGMIKIRRHGRLYQLHTRELAVRWSGDGSLKIIGMGARQGRGGGLMRATLILTSNLSELASAHAATAVLEDLEVAPDSDRIIKACVNSIGDLSHRNAEINLCDTNVLDPASSDRLVKVFARIPLTSSPSRIAEKLPAIHQTSPCVCYGESGSAVACPRN